MIKNVFEMPVELGADVWIADEPYRPYCVIGYRIGRMAGEDEEDYGEDCPETEWYIQLSNGGTEMSIPVSDIGHGFFITQADIRKGRTV